MSGRRRPMAIPQWWLDQVAARRRRRELVLDTIALVLFFLFVLFVLPFLAVDALPVAAR